MMWRLPPTLQVPQWEPEVRPPNDFEKAIFSHFSFKDLQFLPRHLLTPQTLFLSQYFAAQPPPSRLCPSLLECRRMSLRALSFLWADSCAPWLSRHRPLRLHHWTLVWRHETKEVPWDASFPFQESSLSFPLSAQGHWPWRFIKILVSERPVCLSFPSLKLFCFCCFSTFVKCRHLLSSPILFMDSLKAPQLL